MATQLTVDQFRQWSDQDAWKRWELLRGTPTEMPEWPEGFHAVHMRIADLLGDYVIRRGFGSVAFLSGGLITQQNPDTVRCPAVMVLLDPTPTGEFPLRFTTRVPRLVVDLAVPGEPHGRAMRRVSNYIQFGVSLVWLVAPEEFAVIQFVPKQPPSVLDKTDELTGNGALPEFSCRVSDLFTLPGGQPPIQPE